MLLLVLTYASEISFRGNILIHTNQGKIKKTKIPQSNEEKSSTEFMKVILKCNKMLFKVTVRVFDEEFSVK